MPKEIRSLADGLLHDPVSVAVDPVSSAVETVEQKVYFTDKAQKRDLLVHLLDDPSCQRVIVFTRTKHGSDRVARHLARTGKSVAAIHGNKAQNARTRALEGFRDGSIQILVATDIAARGIDVDDVTHVFNFDVPNIPETYVHRIGRTGRAGKGGVAISLCEGEERDHLDGIERLLARRINRVTSHPFEARGDATGTRAATPNRGPARGAHGAPAHARARSFGPGGSRRSSTGRSSRPKSFGKKPRQPSV
jgi:ATP-dependent RNA helicase RhlE